MDRFEEDLRRALSGRIAPEGSAERILARLPKRNRSSVLWPVAALLALAIALPMGLHYDQQRRSRNEAEKTKQQVLEALRITRETVEAVEGQLIEGQH